MNPARLLALCAALAACADRDLTAQEEAALGDMVLGGLPKSPSNAVADDRRAAALGKELFFDPSFSGPLQVGDDGQNGGLGPVGATGRVSCASCHDVGQGGSDHRSRGPTSLAAAWTHRNAPTVINVAYSPSPWMFWDGRKDSLWSQALGPVESAAEMNSSRLQVAHLLYDKYRAPYEEVFGPISQINGFPAQGKPGDAAFDGMAAQDREAVNRCFANFGKAIEAYERTLVDVDSPFDRYMTGDRSALSQSAVRGARLFVGRASCNDCHAGPLLSDGKFHIHGVPQTGANVPEIDRGRADGIAQVLADPFNQAGPYSDVPADAHLAGLRAQDSDLGAFKTATLRNVNRTAPYMHTGGFQTLWQVVDWYRHGAGTDGFVGKADPSMRQLALSDEDVADLVSFLQSLDGSQK